MDEGILYADAIVVLGVAEVFGIDDVAVGGAGCCEYGSVPVGNPKSVTKGQRGAYDLKSHVFNVEPLQVVDEFDGLSVSQCSLARWTSSLGVELSQYLGRERHI